MQQTLPSQNVVNSDKAFFPSPPFFSCSLLTQTVLVTDYNKSSYFLAYVDLIAYLCTHE